LRTTARSPALKPALPTRGIVKDEQHDLLVKGGNTVTVRLFRKKPGDAPFSAELTLASKGR
jgi:hypothetical protein